MREIKFKAWDGEKMHEWEDVQYDEVYRLGSLNSSSGILIWLEYTGLHDRNGREIYEGDILKTIYGHIDLVQHGKHLSDNGGEYGEHWGWSIGYSLPLHADEDYEIIGNIYENPELLKK